MTIELNQKVLTAQQTLRESKQILRVLLGKEVELSALQTQVNQALVELGRVRTALQEANATFERVKDMHLEARGQWTKAEKEKLK